MINVAKFSRTKNIPYLGICLGMQVAVIEFARNVLKLSANSTEFEKNTDHPVIARNYRMISIFFKFRTIC